MRPFLRALAVTTCLVMAPLALSVATPSAAVAADYPEGRLPDTAKPSAYRLSLTIIPSKERFSGHTEIDVDLKAGVASLFMHGRDLTVTKAVAVQNGKAIEAVWTQVDPLGVARVDFKAPLQAGKVTLKFDYDAPFGDGPAGLYRVKVGDDWYAWTQFESIDARAAFPSFDEPGFKTPYSVSITTEPGLVVASNAPEKDSVKSGNLVTHTFIPTKPLPSYLVAMVVGPFAVAEGVAPPTPQRSWPLPIRIIATKPNKDKLNYALTETPSIVAHLESYFNQPFPYPKLDQIGSPIMPGAMENAGADIYGDTILLLDDGAPTSQRKTFGMVVAHELSHQWFGDYVTPAWWDDIWLNESFANWMGFRIGNEWRPELNIGVGGLAEGFSAMPTDAMKVGRPIHEKITKNGDIDSAFDGITYGKGGQVIAMIAAYLGDNNFREGVRLHMSRHPYGNATTEEFFGALADAAKDPRVLESMKSFINQQGVPVVDIVRKDGRLIGTQSRYSYYGSTLTPQSWIIPVCLREGSERNCTLMDKTTVDLGAAKPGAIIPNAGGTGYYRFSLTPSDWDALLATGATLPAAEGIAAIDSLWAQFEAGKLPAAELITAAKALADNPDSSVAIGAGERLTGLWGDGMVASETEAKYRGVIGGIYGPRLSAMGFNPANGAYKAEAAELQSRRRGLVSLLAGSAKDTSVRKTLLDAATAYLNGNTNALDQTYLGSGLSIYVQEGGLPAAKAMFERAVTSTQEGFRGRALGAVTAGAKLDTADWVLNTAMNDKRLRNSEKISLLGGLFYSRETRDTAFTWLKANYASFSAGAGIFSAGRIASLPGVYCDTAKADEIDALMRPKVIAAGRGELSFNRTLEAMKTCSALKAAKSAEVNQAFIDAQ
jgi:hypothetical protein